MSSSFITLFYFSVCGGFFKGQVNLKPGSGFVSLCLLKADAMLAVLTVAVETGIELRHTEAGGQPW